MAFSHRKCFCSAPRLSRSLEQGTRTQTMGAIGGGQSRRERENKALRRIVSEWKDRAVRRGTSRSHSYFVRIFRIECLPTRFQENVHTTGSCKIVIRARSPELDRRVQSLPRDILRWPKRALEEKTCNSTHPSSAKPPSIISATHRGRCSRAQALRWPASLR